MFRFILFVIVLALIVHIAVRYQAALKHENAAQPVATIHGADMPREIKLTTIQAAHILDAKLKPENDAEVATVREYFKAIAKMVWLEGESFSGKRPFGNSGWYDDIAWALVNAKIVEGTIDEDGYADGYDFDKIHPLVMAALDFM